MKGIVFLPEMRTIGGTRTIDRNIIQSRDGRALDKVLATAGTIQVLPKEALRPFGALRKSMENTLLSKGTRFFGGYLADEQVAVDISNELQILRGKLLDARDRLAANLDSLIQARIDEAPEWEDVIRSLAPSREEILDSIRFSWVKAPVDLQDPEVEEALQGDPLVIRIAREIAQIAASYLGRGLGTTQKGIPGLSVLSQIATKAKALSFVDGRFTGLYGALQGVCQDAQSAKKGPHEIGAALAVRGVIETLRNPATILEIGEAGVVDVPNFADLSPKPESKQEETPVETQEANDKPEDMDFTHDSDVLDVPVPEAVTNRASVLSWI